MDDKQKIITDEIKKWRENNLLPETYCDFLLQLYTEGEDTPPRETLSLKRYIKKLFSGLGILTVLLGTAAFIIYFTQFSPAIQTGILGSFLVLSMLTAFFLKRKGSVYVHLYVILAAFISFIMTVSAADLVMPGNTVTLGISITLLCIIWIVFGWRFRYHYLYIAGSTGILLFLAFLLV